jgi:MerR family transcriptional regulator/heat shock protein HspR
VSPGRARRPHPQATGDARRRALAALDAALDDGRAPRFSIGQVADLLDVRPWFLRRLDAMGVVTPTRSGGDQRRYSREDLARLIDARALMSEGVSVAGIRQVLELRDRVAELESALAESRRWPRGRGDGSAAAG